MFVLYDKETQKHPIRVWLETKEQIELGCLEQVINLSNLPFVHRHVALMPDTHQGYGMPIGGVIATNGVIIPNAVGVDIGCGMAFVQTNIPATFLREKTSNGSLAQSIVGDIMRSIPLGFNHHKEKQNCSTLDNAGIDPYLTTVEELIPEIESGYYQVGTLGGGNHFIELQEDEEGYVALMLHSGSRNFGFKICKYFNEVAKKINAKWFSSVPKIYDLAFLPVDTKEGSEYIAWMNLALKFAQENRDKMLAKVKEILFDQTIKAGFGEIKETLNTNAHHNYAAQENHYGKNVWVHRKGAICVRKGTLGIIPGAMGSFSYIVEGLGNQESFNSCSHGAGRRMGRKEASRNFTTQQTMDDLKERGVILGKHKKTDVAEESRFAYKDIDFVISQELDLVLPIKKLKTLAVVKA